MQVSRKARLPRRVPPQPQSALRSRHRIHPPQGGIGTNYRYNEKQLNIAEEKIDQLFALTKDLTAKDTDDLLPVSYTHLEKIPQIKREHIWLLAQQSHVLWVIGGRISAVCKIKEEFPKDGILLSGTHRE